MAHPINTSTVKADLGTCYKYLYCIGRTWHIVLIPLLYRQNMAHPINTAMYRQIIALPLNTATV